MLTSIVRLLARQKETPPVLRREAFLVVYLFKQVGSELPIR